VGEESLGVPVAEFIGEVCCDREPYRVYWEGDAAKCCAGIAKSVAMAVRGWRWEDGTRIQIVDDEGRIEQLEQEYFTSGLASLVL
jgi:hypothetical protein